MLDLLKKELLEVTEDTISVLNSLTKKGFNNINILCSEHISSFVLLDLVKKSNINNQKYSSIFFHHQPLAQNNYSKTYSLPTTSCWNTQCKNHSNLSLEPMIQDSESVWLVPSSQDQSLFLPQTELFGYYQDNFKKEKESEELIDNHLGNTVVCSPTLGWTELNYWLYAKENNINYSDIYNSRNGSRIIAPGCSHCRRDIKSEAISINDIFEEVFQCHNAPEEDEELYKLFEALGYI